MKKLICILLAVILLCGCSVTKPSETTLPPETTQAPTIPTYAEVENPVQFLSVSMGEDY